MVMEDSSLKPKIEKAIIIGVATSSVSLSTLKSHLHELARLAYTAGAEVCEEVIQRRAVLDPATLIGQGKLEFVSSRVKHHGADLVIFDEDLSGSQVKKIESVLATKILDRSGLILDIFARNAKTAEAKIQVEVAQLEYMLPRLTRAWTHLSRQVGGIGTRGPGETQLEVDRRLVRKRISDLKKRLKKNEAIKQRQHERRYPTFHISLVGYTNAGKSSLMNAITKSNVLVEDKLFATLDSTTRKLFLGTQAKAVLSDTVGFIRKLPHNLIESFKSTLSVVSESSLILHVIDASEEDALEHMEVTAKVLRDMDTLDIPNLTVFNKIDLIPPSQVKMMMGTYPDAIFISALSKSGIKELLGRITEYYHDIFPYPYEQGTGFKAPTPVDTCD